ncbi:MAG: PLP-dependent aminotransferase family protein [Bacteroidales bacterium]|nr:PLP-dependent aminotransferase family protein [Bacteroidales bacterium]
METLVSRISQRFEEKNLRHKSKKNTQVLYQRIYTLIKDSIQDNDIPESSILPSTRALSDELKVSRSTIIKAYELLTMEGYLEAVVGSGHRVKGMIPDLITTSPESHSEFAYPDLSDTGKSFQKNVILINTTDDVGIAFRPGLPPLDIFPVNQWKNLTNLYWRNIKASALTYSASSGTEQLKKTLASYLNFSRSIKCDPRQIIIVSGSLQSLFLIGNVVLNPGDYMSMENPTFPNVLSIFKGLRADIQAVGIDEQGIRVCDMTEPGHINSKLVHTTPSSHYPTGIRMSLTRRLELLEWANKHKSILIENDYEHEVNNYRDFVPSLFALDKEQRTIFLGTFNRLLHPSIRVGYMVVPYYLLDAVEALLKHSHRFVPSSIQVVLSQFIERNYLYSHVKKVIEIAEGRQNTFFNTFEECFGGSLSLNHSQTRSLHALTELGKCTKDTDLVAHLAKNNIITHAYSKCFVGETKKQGLILGYSPVRSSIIKQKIIQMEKLYRGGIKKT